MNDHELRRMLEALGPEAPEAEVDPRFDLLLDGQLDDAQTARLMAFAAASRDQRDAPDLFEPLDDDFLTRAAQRAIALRDAPLPADLAPLVPATAPSRPSAAEPTDVPEPSGPGWWRALFEAMHRPVVLGPLLGLAVALLFVPSVLTSTRDLPGYHGEILSGDRAQRSDDVPADGPARFSAGSLVEVRLVPDEPVDLDFTADATVIGGTADVPMEVTVRSTEGGVMLVRGLLPDAAAEPPGPRVLRLSIHPKRPVGADPGHEAVVELPIAVGGDR